VAQVLNVARYLRMNGDPNGDHVAQVAVRLGPKEDQDRSTREPPTIASRPSAKRTQAFPLPS
jgi:hypothetical protein